MIIESIVGTVQRIFKNDRVRLGIINNNGHVSYTAYVHRTKTLHQFISGDSMQDFAVDMGLISDSEPVSRDAFKTRIRPFVLRKWKERKVQAVNTNGMSASDRQDAYANIRSEIEKGHIQVKGSGIMTESTWTEFDNEAFFLAPHGIILGEPGHEFVEKHKKGNGWIYQLLDEVLFELNDYLAQ